MEHAWKVCMRGMHIFVMRLKVLALDFWVKESLSLSAKGRTLGREQFDRLSEISSL